MQASDNPLTDDSRAGWDRLIGAVSPASMLVAIRGWMSAALATRLDPEDVWQETLCMAWRDRARFEWRGVGAFRRWLLEIARNRVRDLGDQQTALKRGGGRERTLGGDSRDESTDRGDYAGPVATTTPSRVLADREVAARLLGALDAVPDEWRDVVRLRLFEDLTMEDVAQRLDKGEVVDASSWISQRPDLRSGIEAAVALAREVALVRPTPLPEIAGYRFVRELGRGGMGVVYLAGQVSLGRQVALKVLPDAALSDRARQRFLAEARALGRIAHPNVVAVYEVIDAPEFCAFSMEWVRGTTLAQASGRSHDVAVPRGARDRPRTARRASARPRASRRQALQHPAP